MPGDKFPQCHLEWRSFGKAAQKSINGIFIICAVAGFLGTNQVAHGLVVGPSRVMAFVQHF